MKSKRDCDFTRLLESKKNDSDSCTAKFSDATTPDYDFDFTVLNTKPLQYTTFDFICKVYFQLIMWCNLPLCRINSSSMLICKRADSWFGAQIFSRQWTKRVGGRAFKMHCFVWIQYLALIWAQHLQFALHPLSLT